VASRIPNYGRRSNGPSFRQRNWEKASLVGKWVAFRHDLGDTDRVGVLNTRTKTPYFLNSKNSFFKPMPFWNPGGTHFSVIGLYGISLFYPPKGAQTFLASASTSFHGTWSSRSFYFPAGQNRIGRLKRGQITIHTVLGASAVESIDFFLKGRIYGWFETSRGNQLGAYDIARKSMRFLSRPSKKERCAISRLSPSKRFVSFTCTVAGKPIWKLARFNQGWVRILAQEAGLHPRWSPSGRKVVFTRERELYVYSLRSKKSEYLTHGNLID